VVFLLKLNKQDQDKAVEEVFEEFIKQYVNMFAEDLKQGFNRFNPLEEFIDHGQYINMKK